MLRRGVELVGACAVYGNHVCNLLLGVCMITIWVFSSEFLPKKVFIRFFFPLDVPATS